MDASGVDNQSGIENPAYENAGEIVEYKGDTQRISPIFRRTSSYYGGFDSISELTVPSEFAQCEIEEFESRKKQNDAKKKNNIQYNLRFDKVVIVGGNEKKEMDIDQPVSNAVNEIITQKINFEEIPRKYVGLDENKLTKLIQKKRFFIPAITLILLLIGGLSYLLYDALSNKAQYGMTSTTTESNDNDATSTISSTDTTTQNIYSYKILTHSEWETENDSLPIAGPYKLTLPVNKIILLDAITSQCETEEMCIEYMNEQQQNAYPDYEDIRENFIIALDGTIYEGRGFEREGETTCESDKVTCYNNGAISISFIKDPTDDYGISEKQHLTFCHFIEDKKVNGSIGDSLNIFDHDKLIASSVAPGDFEKLRDCSALNRIPQIERRNNTNAIEDVDENLLRRFSTSVRITATGVESYTTKENCSTAIQALQEKNEHPSNFMFCGNEYIFEDRNFDLAVNDTLYDVLLIMFIGNYSTSPPPSSLITKFHDFLKYSIALGKLPESPEICVTNEAEALINVLPNLNPTKCIELSENE